MALIYHLPASYPELQPELQVTLSAVLQSTFCCCTACCLAASCSTNLSYNNVQGRMHKLLPPQQETQMTLPFFASSSRAMGFICSCTASHEVLSAGLQPGMLLQVECSGNRKDLQLLTDAVQSAAHEAAGSECLALCVSAMVEQAASLAQVTLRVVTMADSLQVVEV